MFAKRTVRSTWLARKAIAALLTTVAVVNLSTCGVMEQLDPASLTGAFEAEVRSWLGSPSVADEFVLDGNLREFRIELFNHFTPEEVAAASIPIRELTWTRGDRQVMTLWLERSDDTWKVVHGLIWYQDADF